MNTNESLLLIIFFNSIGAIGGLMNENTPSVIAVVWFNSANQSSGGNATLTCAFILLLIITLK